MSVKATVDKASILSQKPDRRPESQKYFENIDGDTEAIKAELALLKAKVNDIYNQLTDFLSDGTVSQYLHSIKADIQTIKNSLNNNN